VLYQVLTDARQITSDHWRLFFFHSKETLNNSKGVYVVFRAIKFFFRWYMDEEELEG
jgi:hypothetical protein